MCKVGSFPGYIVYDASTSINDKDNITANGRCFCETADSNTCDKLENNGYIRYDYNFLDIPTI